MTTLRKIASFTHGYSSTKVYRDVEFNEYRVRLFVGGVLRQAADYHTDDKNDAIATGRKMLAIAMGMSVDCILQD